MAWAAGAALAVGGCTAGIVIAVQGGGGRPAGGQPATNGSSVAAPAASSSARPLGLVSVSTTSLSQAGGAQGVDGAASIVVTYNEPPPAAAPLPRLSPAIAGSWQRTGDTEIFSPAVGYAAGTHVTVTVAGLGNTRTRSESSSFKTAQYSPLRLQEILAQLGYLPLSWAPATGRGGARGERHRAARGGLHAAPRDLRVAAGVPGGAALVLVTGHGEHPRPGGDHRVRIRPRAAAQRDGRARRVEGTADRRGRRPPQHPRLQLRDRQPATAGDADHLA